MIEFFICAMKIWTEKKMHTQNISFEWHVAFIIDTDLSPMESNIFLRWAFLRKAANIKNAYQMFSPERSSIFYAWSQNSCRQRRRQCYFHWKIEVYTNQPKLYLRKTFVIDVIFSTLNILKTVHFELESI